MKKLLLTLALCGALYGSDTSVKPSINNFDQLNYTVCDIVYHSFPDASPELLQEKVNGLANLILYNTQLFSSFSAATDNPFITRNTIKLVIYILDGHFDRIKRKSLSEASQNANTAQEDFDSYLHYINSLSEQAKNNLKLLPQMGKVLTKDEWNTQVASAPNVTLTGINPQEAEDTFSKEQQKDLNKFILSAAIASEIIQRSFPNRNIFETSNEEILEEQTYLHNNMMISSQEIKGAYQHKEHLFHFKNRFAEMIYILDAYIKRFEHMQEKTSYVEEQLEYAKETVGHIRKNLKDLDDLK
jgi:hypothetical protein